MMHSGSTRLPLTRRTFGASIRASGLLLAAVALIASIATTIAYAETDSLSAIGDTWLDQNDQTTNHGTGTTVLVKGRASHKRRTLVQFDLASLPACVAGVSGGTLRLHLLSNSLVTPVTHHVHRMTQSWTETGATWLAHDGTTSWTTGGGDYVSTQTASAGIPVSAAFVDWDVSSDVAAFLNNTAVNKGWTVKDSVEGSGGGSPSEESEANTVLSYDSRESSTSAYRPRLILSYTVVPGSCDDGNPCTDDACTLTGCAHTPNNASCNDGSYCNGPDTCGGGTCSVHAGDPCAGPDGDANCSESCNEATDTCTAPDPNGTACTDGLYCNGSDTCGGGSCVLHTGDPCAGPDGDANCSESCNEATDTCTAPDPNGSACADGLHCNGSDTCSGGSCSLHAGDPCPGPDGDGNCSESCNEATDTCTAADPNGSGCNDGTFCNGADACNAGSCSSHGGDPCTGGSECADACNESAGNCYDPAGTSCTDDGNVCTNDRCNGYGACAHPDNSAPCDDGAHCNGTDTCSGGSCSLHTGDPCAGPDGDGNCSESCNEATDTCTAADPNGSACTDGLFCNGTDTCSAGACAAHSGDPCPGPDGDVNCTESCNEAADDCTGADPNGAACADDGDVCTNDACNGAGACAHPFNTAPCDDGDSCTFGDACSAGACQASPSCGNGTVEAGCGEQCEPPNQPTCDASCQYIHACGNGVLEPTETCDDGNTLGGDCCDATCQLNPGPCDDGNACTVNDVCVPSGCAGEPLDCSSLDSACTQGQCDPDNGECQSMPANEGGPCNDGNACSDDDVCLSGICSACGNGSVDAGCGETCDPPASGSCDPTCLAIACGNNVIQAGEECDDGNATSGDGCSNDCKFEEKVCIVGTEPSVSLAAKVVAFASPHDYVGLNPDGNREIYLFQRKKFDKALKVLRKKNSMDLTTAKNTLLGTRAAEFFSQVTDTAPPVANEYPAINAGANTVAFVSNGDLKPGAPGNADANREIFRFDIKQALLGNPGALIQVTNTAPGISNANPNLRAFSNLLTFDSNGNLMPDRCVGGTEDLQPCATNAECAGTTCGNPEGNREVFVHVQKAYVFGDRPLRQLTAAPSGDSTVGQSANFSSRATAFSSTSNLLGANPEYNAEIFRIARAADSLAIITSTAAANQEEPAQSVRARIAFTSNGDLAGQNADRNREIFLFDEYGSPQTRQIEDPRGVSIGCYNAGPSIDGLGRFIAFHSTCNRIASLGNPPGFRSIFIWDDRKLKLLPLVVRGEGNTEGARPQATKRVSVLTYESNLDSVANPAICFLNVRNLLKTLETQ